MPKEVTLLATKALLDIVQEKEKKDKDKKEKKEKGIKEAGIKHKKHRYYPGDAEWKKLYLSEKRGWGNNFKKTFL